MVPIQRYSRTVTVCLENGVSQMPSVFVPSRVAASRIPFVPALHR